MAECRCDGVEVGTFAHTVTMVDPSTDKPVGIDVCIATEIAELWNQGIRTMASCCGHGKHPPSVCVAPEHNDRMRELGYVLAPAGVPQSPLVWLLGEDGFGG